MKKWICILLFTGFLSAASTDSKAEKDVLAAMDAWKQATMKKDAAALDKLLHPDLTYSHSSAANQTKVLSGNNCINFWAGDCSSSRHETCLS